MAGNRDRLMFLCSESMVAVGDFALKFNHTCEIPGLEKATALLLDLIFGDHAAICPQGELFKINGLPVYVSRNTEGTYYFANRTNVHELITGNSMQSVIEENYIAMNDECSLSQAILASIIINPGNGKPNNCILNPYFQNSSF